MNRLPFVWVALFELKKLGLEDQGLQESIVRILGPYVRAGIENKALLDQRSLLDQPKEDVFLACEIASIFYEETSCSIDLESIKASNLEMDGIKLKGANLKYADLQGADLGTAKNLTAEQLLKARIDDSTKLDPDLRAEYERLKAEQQ